MKTEAKTSRWILAGALMCACAATSAAPGPKDAADQAMATISAAAMRGDMRFLSSDLLEGRRTGTRGYEIAAQYVASRFESMGLEPAGDKGSYFQNVPFRASRADAAHTTMSMIVNGKETSLTFAQDFLGSADPSRPDTSVDAPVVFVGYGITSPELHHDDYQDIDAKGKIVALIYGAPPSFESSMRAHYSSGLTKAATAVAHGAVGYVTLYDPNLERLYSFQHRVDDTESAPDLNWLDPQGHPNDQFPQLQAIARLALHESRKFLEACGKSPDEIFTAAKAGTLKGFDTPVQFKIHVATKSEDIHSPNIAAKLEGSDPTLRNEYVVVTAHLDHMGVGVPVNGDKIYHGTLDNGSGSAALLEIAQAMAGMHPRPRRSILFVSVTGEEEGLLGADYFAHYPTVPKSSMVADVNMDEDIMLWPLEDIVAYGAEHSSLARIANEAGERLSLSISPDQQPEQVIFIRSDQYAFVKQGVPAMLTNAGDKSNNPAINPKKIEEAWKDKIYHSPQDNMSQPGLDFESGAKFARFNFLCAYLTAQQTARPTWNAHDFFGDRYARK
ncbi:MAG TPA: M28 family metallopeptidase [Candidatus Acidoferrales bacterium]|nr:M28 family metallopeptidase [Candidatus Acidoferrales bacterium]